MDDQGASRSGPSHHNVICTHVLDRLTGSAGTSNVLPYQTRRNGRFRQFHRKPCPRPRTGTGPAGDATGPERFNDFKPLYIYGGTRGKTALTYCRLKPGM
jgi:hypothetical protein